MAIFKGGKNRDDTFTGSTKADRFDFDPLDLTRGDTIVGGEGRAVDVLRFATPGAIGISALAGASGIERIELADGGANSVVLTDDFVASANGGRVTVVGGDGDDLVYAAQLTGENAISVIAGAGSDVLLGGLGADSFVFTTSTLDGSDVVTALNGAAADRLILTGSGTVAATQMAGVTGIETIEFGDGGVGIEIGDALVRSAGEAGVTVIGGAGSDTIDASAVVYDPTAPVALRGGGGDDTIVGNRCFIDGGEGADTIDGEIAGVVYDGADVHEIVTSGALLIEGAATIDLTRSDDQSSGDAAIVRGFTTADAYASVAAVSLTGGDYNALIGGSADDTLKGGTYLEGGRGADLMIGSATAATVFKIGRNDFAAGETIVGNYFVNFLNVTGSVDFRKGSLEGSFYLSVLSTGTGATHIIVSEAQARQFTSVNYILAAEGDTISYDIYLDGDASEPFTTSVYGATVHGTRAADVVVNENGSVLGGGGVDHLTGTTLDGGAGDDVLSGGTFGIATVAGGDGDDVLTSGFFFRGGTLDGGAGTDTLVATDWSPSAATEFDLSSRQDQAGRADMNMRGYENLDLSRISENFYHFNVVGSAGDNVITGGHGDNTVSGGGGDDLLTVSAGHGANVYDGGFGDDVIRAGTEFSNNTLTGGAGADDFVFDRRSSSADFSARNVVSDYHAGLDTLKFGREGFAVSGRALDTIMTVGNTSTDITGADVVIYTGKLDVETFINEAAGGRSRDGLFVVMKDGDGGTAIYHSTSADYADSRYNLIQVADLQHVRPGELTLADFAFI